MATFTASSLLDDPARRASRAPMLAAITMARGGDGVAVVANLLWRAVERHWPDARLVTMFDGRARTPGLTDKASFAASLMTELAAHRPGAIVYSHLGLARAQAYVPSLLERPFAVFLHGVEAWGALAEADVRLLQQARLRLANSEFTASRVSEAHPSIGAIVACPLALVEDGYASIVLSADAADALPNEGPIVLVVGRMHAAEAYKGHDQLIEAWPAVIAQIPTANLVMVGDWQRPAAAGAQSPSRRRLPANTLSRVRAGRIARRVLSAGIGVRPSEPRRRLRARLPRSDGPCASCIGSRQDAAGDVIVDGTTGHLVDQTDTAALGARIVQLLANEPERRSMGDAGRRRLLTKFSEAAFGARLVAALEAAFDDDSR
jgi:phosphatidylinositol alpha-1,6-mannosyltransferase